MSETPTAAPPSTTNVLEIDDVHVYYGAIHALKGVSLTVGEGEIVTLIGANGAGKSTTLRAINGLNRPRQGSIRFQGADITHAPSHAIVKGGIAQSPEGRRLFPRMSVTENLEMGAFQRSDKENFAEDMDRVFELFPRLHERRTQKAGTMSGGEQQMCAIGRALMSRPKMILLDEPSMGLAPQLVEEIFGIVGSLNRKEKVSFLLAEQNTRLALKYARYGYVLENGRVVLDGEATVLGENQDVKEFYLGIAEGKRKSFREGKHYRRRKRWLA
jgi:branched-chain amino acid transport system ATP-binding protein